MSRTPRGLSGTAQWLGVSVTVLARGQLHVGPRPEAAQVSYGQVERDAHLPGHDDEAHVPAQGGHDEQQSATSLPTRIEYYG